MQSIVTINVKSGESLFVDIRNRSGDKLSDSPVHPGEGRNFTLNDGDRLLLVSQATYDKITRTRNPGSLDAEDLDDPSHLDDAGHVNDGSNISGLPGDNTRPLGTGEAPLGQPLAGQGTPFNTATEATSTSPDAGLVKADGSAAGANSADPSLPPDVKAADPSAASPGVTQATTAATPKSAEDKEKAAKSPADRAAHEARREAKAAKHNR
jgi:hypothetical protein